MWILNAFILIVFTESSGLDYRIESLPSSSTGKIKSCPMNAFDNGWTCSVIQQYEDKGKVRVGEGTTCWNSNDSSSAPLKCTNGIWKRVIGKVKRAVASHFASCPSDQHLEAPPGEICAIATWTPPSEEVDSHTGGESGDCFPAGDHEIVYGYDGTWTWSWVSSDTCQFTIHVSVYRCSPLPSIDHGNIHCNGAGDDTVWGSLCTSSCESGYYLQGASTTECIVESNTTRWSNSFPSCVYQEGQN